MHNSNLLQTSGCRGSTEKIEKLDFSIPIIPNTPENHETWHGVMTWHQHATVIFLAELGQALV